MEQEYNPDTGEYEYILEDLPTCKACSAVIYESEPRSYDREGDAICKHCASSLVEVAVMEYHNDGIHFDILDVAIPASEAITLHLEIAPECVVDGITVPALIEDRLYDKTNLPDFVELHEGTYRYVPGMRVKF